MDIDLRELEVRQAHDLLTSSILPRPIAWVCSISSEGKLNVAPFSFFTGVQWHPPILAFSVVNKADGTKKDTVINVEQTKEFVINVVSTELLEAMEYSARPLPYGEDEKLIKGIRFVPSKTIQPPRIEEAKVSFECVLEQIVRPCEGANAGNLILGRVQLMHVKDELVVNSREIDWEKLSPLGRLSGNRYCVVDTVIESETN